MSNKSAGTAFEKEFAELLAGHGFWAHCLKENTNGQPFDVIAARDGVTYVFDCKECESGRFPLSRIEENQNNAMLLWQEMGNQPGMFAIRFFGQIYLIPHRMLMNLKRNGTKSIAEQHAIQYGKTLEQWIFDGHKMIREVAP